MDTRGVVVDLSNVVRDETLSAGELGVTLRRWEVLKRAWIAEMGQPTDGFRLVADSNLPIMLPTGDRRILEKWATGGELIVTIDADATLLDLAVSENYFVLSCDAFTDHLQRRGVSALEVYRWFSRSIGKIEFARRRMTLPMSYEMTRRAEKEERKILGSARANALLPYKWYCRDSGCPEGLVVPSDRGEDTPRCFSCGSYLERGSLWDRPLWIKVLDDGKVHRRFALEDGEVRVLGRFDAIDTESVLSNISEDVASRISRRHLILRNVDGDLMVTDLSSNGCLLQHAAPKGRGWLPPVKLTQGQERRLKLGDRIVFNTTKVMLELSGRE